jgi:hypothetical protein
MQAKPLAMFMKLFSNLAFILKTYLLLVWNVAGNIRRF